MKIDLNRGVTIRRHASTGVQVFMYKDDPGVFLNAHGTEVDPALAASAGFDIDTLLKEKVKRERQAVAMAAIEAEFSAGPAKSEVVRSVDGFNLVAVGLGRHKVLDPDGEELHSTPLTLEEANLLLDQLTHTQPEAPVEDLLEAKSSIAVMDGEIVAETKVDPKSKVGHLAGKPAAPVYPKPPLGHVEPTDKDKLAAVAKGAKKKG